MLSTLARHRSLEAEMIPQFGVCFRGRLQAELTDCGAPVHELGLARFSRPWSLWSARRRLTAIVRREKIDVALCHGIWAHAAFAGTARRAGAALAYFAHDVPTGGHWLERLGRRVKPDLVLANSGYTAASVGKLFPGVRTEVQYPPVEPLAPMVHAAVRAQVRQELKCPADAVVIAIACRLERWKGHTRLLDALGSIARDSRWRCWIAGGVQRASEQAYFDELQERARRLGIADRVTFLGQCDDVARLYAAADVHCQPNTGTEPFGVAFIEALYAGLNVVTTDAGGAREILAEPVAQKRAWLVAPNEVEALAIALQDALHRAGTLPRSASVPDRFRLDQTMNSLSRLLRNVRSVSQ